MRVYTILLGLLLAGSYIGVAQTSKIIFYPDSAREKISRHIYGHFSEHLGRCIYGGYWVDENSNIR